MLGTHTHTSLHLTPVKKLTGLALCQDAQRGGGGRKWRTHCRLARAPPLQPTTLSLSQPSAPAASQQSSLNAQAMRTATYGPFVKYGGVERVAGRGGEKAANKQTSAFLLGCHKCKLTRLALSSANATVLKADAWQTYTHVQILGLEPMKKPTAPALCHPV